MKIYYKYLLLFITTSICTKHSIAQVRPIKGKVLDEAGKPVAYASITFKGTGKYGTWTGPDGSYSTNAPYGHDSIICTHVNYNRKSENINGNSIINLVLSKQMAAPSTIIVSGTHKYSAEELAQNKKQPEAEKDKFYFTKVEINASFPGGESAFQRYLSQQVIYPDSATISNVKGIVKVSFIIGKDGFPHTVTLLKGINRFTDELVLNAILKMRKWVPALQNGRNVEQYKEVEVSFDIKGVEQ